MPRFCQVVVPVPLQQVFHYAVPEELVNQIEAGKRVEVPFGPRRLTGYCVSCNDDVDMDVTRIKPLHTVLDESPLLSETLLELTRWIANHYVCPWVDVLQAALPAPTREGRQRAQTTWVKPGAPPNEDTRAALDKKSPKQAMLLDLLNEADGSIERQALLKLAKASASSLNALERRGYVVFESEDRLQDPLQEITAEPETPPILSVDQARVWDTFQTLEPGTLLLRGVTGSGKTEIYLRAIQLCIDKGHQAIILVPEISLTPQTLQRFRARFDNLAVLHSNLTAAQRAQQWSRIHAGEADVIIGARSAIFAPTARLGLVIVDEEHDPSFKQQNSPRYNARDVAILRGRLEQVPVILGSATPQLESWHNVLRQQSTLLELPNRINDLPLPPVHTIDMTLEVTNEGRPRLFSRKTLVQLEQCVARGSQAMLLINRRGYAPVVRCLRCFHVPGCPSCDIALTVHRQLGRLICHYCNHSTVMPTICERCSMPAPKPAGAGTERVEDVIEMALPGIRTLRMDADSTRARGSHRRLLNAFRQGEADILIGTQMIAKGHDFPNVSLVVVVDVDVGLTLPDFRAGERTFGLITQMAGRAGRAGDDGRVLVQTRYPGHYAVTHAANHDVTGFTERELAMREPLRYPPFGRLARIVLSGTDLREVTDLGVLVKQRLPQTPELQILGPAPCPLGRIDNRHRQHILLKAPIHQPIHEALNALGTAPPARGQARFTVDVDPVNLL